MTDYNALIGEAMTRGRVVDVKTHITAALESGIDAGVILKDALISTMEIIGDKFSKNQVFIPEVMMAARAMNEGLAILKPRLIGSGVKALGKVIICTVKGDSHDIGKNLVKIMLEGVGLEVLDLGSNVSTEKVIETVKATGINIVCLSALLTTTMPNLKLVIEKLREEGLKDKVKVLVGGAPVTQEYADLIGADGYSADAAGAARLVKSFLI